VQRTSFFSFDNIAEENIIFRYINTPRKEEQVTLRRKFFFSINMIKRCIIQ